MNNTDKQRIDKLTRIICIILNIILFIIGIWAISELYDFEDLELDFDWPESLSAIIVFGLAVFIRVKVFNKKNIQILLFKYDQEIDDTFSYQEPVRLQESENYSTCTEQYQVDNSYILEGLCSFSASDDYEINYVNDVFSEMIGYTKEDMIIQKHVAFIKLIAVEERDKFQKDVLYVSLEGKDLHTFYHINCCNGQIIFMSVYLKAVRDVNNKVWIQMVFTKAKNQDNNCEQLRKDANRNEILLSQLNDVVFEIDVEEDSVIYSMNWENKLASNVPIERVSEQIRKEKIFHSDDVDCMERLFRDCKLDGVLREEKVQLYGKDKKYIWCIVKLCGVKDQTGKVVRLIGTIKDCDKESIEIEELRKKVEIDELTGLYNKHTIQEKIKSYLVNKQDSESGLMFLIDMDKFKEVNDTFGHYTGDVVLEETGLILKEFAQKYQGDAGRIGGDEFIVFLYHIANLDSVESLLRELKNNLKITIPNTEKIFSGSVGAGVTQADDTFESLYIRVDNKLYEEKKRMKSERESYKKIQTQTELAR